MAGKEGGCTCAATPMLGAGGWRSPLDFPRREPGQRAGQGGHRCLGREISAQDEVRDHRRHCLRRRGQDHPAMGPHRPPQGHDHPSKEQPQGMPPRPGPDGLQRPPLPAHVDPREEPSARIGHRQRRRRNARRAARGETGSRPAEFVYARQPIWTP